MVKQSQTVASYDTRRMRREAVKDIVKLLIKIREAEQKYLDNVPDNLQSSECFEIGENAVDIFDEIISLFADVY